MPFKGDGRLGGRRRNDSTLNGMSEGPDFPASGTFLREEVVTYPIAQGGEEVSVTPTTLSPFVVPRQNVYVHVKADGSNGEYYDWATAHDAFYKPSGEVIMSNGYEGVSYVEVNGSSYVNGGYTSDIVHDGYGNVMSGGGSTSYYSQGTLITQLTEAVNVEYGGNYYQIGTIDVYYSHDGFGWYSTSNSSPSYYPSGTSAGTTGPRGLNTEVTDPVNNFTFTYGYATVDEEIFSDGAGSMYVEQISIEYPTSGSLITHDEVNNVWYTHDGAGGWLRGPYAPYGTPTGGTESGNVEVYIPDGGNDSYYIGSYWGCGVYWDGAGGTYTEGCSYSYNEAGTFIVNYNGYNYYCDGSGSYYSEPE